MHWSEPSNAAHRDHPSRFRVVHPFHPLSGQGFEFVNFGHTWGDQKIWYRKPGEQRTRSMPTSWTDLEAVDPYVALSSGRSFCRPEDLLALAGMVRRLQRSGVSEIMP
ncbi:MAG: DUF5372 family protein [Steroidobacteraceae bacterium]